MVSSFWFNNNKDPALWITKTVPRQYAAFIRNIELSISSIPFNPVIEDMEDVTIKVFYRTELERAFQDVGLKHDQHKVTIELDGWSPGKQNFLTGFQNTKTTIKGHGKGKP